MIEKEILVTRSSMPSFDEYVNEIKELWDSHWLTNMGTKHVKLQEELEKYLGVKHVTLYANGHLALENIIQVYNFPTGSEIITTPFTFASTTHAIVRNNLIPIFCDIGFENYTIDVNKIESLITDKTVAILPVHVYGHICDVDRIEKIAKKNNLKVIYDAAHAFGVKKDGISILNYGDASMLSFHATKVFNTIEGGAICYNDDSLVQILDDNKNFGFRNPEDVAYVGGNAKMNEFQAAMGICNLRHINNEILKRKNIAEIYFKRLNSVEGIKFVQQVPNITYNYAYMPIVFDNYRYSRDEIYDKLKKENIVARKYFYPLTNAFSCYKEYPTANINLTPVAYDISKKVLTLPIYSDLGFEVVDKICNIILD